MSMQEPKGVTATGVNGGEGTVVGTVYFNNTDIYNGTKVTLSDKIRALTPAATTFRAINTVTAYFDHVEREVKDKFHETVLINGNPALTNVEDINDDVKKYMVLIANIALSGVVNGIKCTVEYLKLSNDQYSFFNNLRCTAITPGQGYLNEILGAIAERIDPDLMAPSVPPAANARMLAVIRLNGIKVAYYSSDQNGIMIYPFKTSLCKPEDIPEYSLIGMSYDPATQSAAYSLEDLMANFMPGPETVIVDPRFKTPQLRAQAASNLIEALNALKAGVINNNQKCFNWIINQMRNYFGGSLPQASAVVLMDALEYAYREFGSIYPPAPVDDLQKPTSAYPRRFKIPLKFDSTRVKVTYYSTVNLLTVDSQDPTYSFSFLDGGVLCPVPQYPQGLQLKNSLAGMNNILLKTFVDGTPTGDQQFPLHVINAPMDFDRATNTIVSVSADRIYNVPVFTDKIYGMFKRGKMEIYPVTSAFIELLRSKGYSYIMSPGTPVFGKDEYQDDVLESVSLSVRVVDAGGVNIATFDKVFRGSDVLEEFPIGGGMTEDFTMSFPELSVYPFVKMLDAADSTKSIITRYYWTALNESSNAENVKVDMSFMQRLEITDENGNKLDFSNQNKLCYIRKSGSKFMMATTTALPKTLYFKYVFQSYTVELGLVELPVPPTVHVDTSKIARAAFDMGSRNSIMALQPTGGRVVYDFESKDRHMVVLPGTVDLTVNADGECIEREIAGVEDKPVPYSFVSSFMLPYYIDGGGVHPLPVTAATAVPFAEGRIMANVEMGFYNQLLEEAAKYAGNSTDTLAQINVYSDFKRRFMVDAVQRGMYTPVLYHFVVESVYHMILNALYEGCGNIQLCFSAPDSTSLAQLRGAWSSAIAQVVAHDFAGLPNGLVQIGEMMTEAEALYNSIVHTPTIRLADNSIIIDGGDSTVDISLIKTTINPGNFETSKDCAHTASVPYAGNRIIIKSIAEVCDKLGISSPKDDSTQIDFISIWGGGNGIIGDRVMIPDPKNTRYREELIEKRLFNDNGSKQYYVNWNSESTRQTLYKLVESWKILPFTRHRALPLSEKIAGLIELKYLFNLYISITGCLSKIDKGKDVSVHLYGGTNNVGRNMLWFSNADRTLNLFVQRIFQKFGFGNDTRVSAMIMSTNTSEKTDLVTGLVTKPMGANNQSVYAAAMNTEAVPSDIDTEMQSDVDEVIKTVLDKDLFPNFWKNGQCIAASNDGLNFSERYKDQTSRIGAYAQAYKELLGLNNIQEALDVARDHDERTRFNLFVLNTAINNYLRNLTLD